MFNFYLKQTQRFSVWSFTENAFFISSMEEFGLDIQKHVSLKQTKIYLSKNKKT